MEADDVARCAREIAAAIGRRDRRALEALIAPDFVHRTPGGATTTADVFLDGIEAIPGDILSVVLEELVVDVAGGAALATGMQHAQVRIDGQVIDDRRAFADWFVKDAAGWRLRVAVELPPAA